MQSYVGTSSVKGRFPAQSFAQWYKSWIQAYKVIGGFILQLSLALSSLLYKILIVPLNSRHTPSEFVKPVSSKGLTLDDIHLSPDDLEMYIDLAPFLNPSPYIVPEDMSLTKVIICLYM